MPRHKITPQVIDSLPWPKIKKSLKTTSKRKVFEQLIEPMDVMSIGTFLNICREREIFGIFCTSEHKRVARIKNNIRLKVRPYTEMDDLFVLVAKRLGFADVKIGSAIDRSESSVRSRILKLRKKSQSKFPNKDSLKINMIPVATHPLLKRRYAYY